MNAQVEFEKQKKRFADWLKKHHLDSISPIQHDQVVIDKLLPLCFEERKDNLSLHACWLLEKYIKAYPTEASMIIPEVIIQIEHIHIEGSQRILGNILIETLSHRNDYKLSNKEEEAIIETTFYWLIAPEKAVAVIANCFEILSYLSDKHPWVKDELIAQIDFFMKEGSAAIQARGRKILKKLKKNT